MSEREKSTAPADMVSENNAPKELIFDESVCSAEFAEGCKETVAEQAD